MVLALCISSNGDIDIYMNGGVWGWGGGWIILTLRDTEQFYMLRSIMVTIYAQHKFFAYIFTEY